jgi:nitrogen fixation/metabolism regulation signal transduction histidine kinase
MAYRNFRLYAVLRVLLLTVSLFSTVYLTVYTEDRHYAVLVFLLGLIIYQVIALIHFVDKTNRDLQRFLDGIRYEDFSQTFREQGFGKSFDDLRTAFNQIIAKFQRTRAEKEEHFRYLQTVVQHIGIGLIVFDATGKVHLFNAAAKRLFQLPVLHQITDLSRYSAELVTVLSGIQSGQYALVKVPLSDEIIELSIRATEFRMQDKNFFLVSLQNIQSELAEKEMDAWQNLIRVLTHEIMNSVTPIASLASTLNTMVKSDLKQSEPADSQEDLQEGLQTIQKRSEGLLRFIEAYRGLTRVPKPKVSEFQIRDLLHRIEQLMMPDIQKQEIGYKCLITPEDLNLSADRELIEQVLINLIKNAVEAVRDSDEPVIELSSRIDPRGKIVIQVMDNGPGICQEDIDKIFVPFFTTKSEGTGIGLSLSRQIMRLHQGSITVRSETNQTRFTLRF